MTKGGVVALLEFVTGGENRRSLGFARDDKGGVVALLEHLLLDERTQIPRLRSG